MGNHIVRTTGTAWINLKNDNREYNLPFHVIAAYANDLLSGIDNLSKMGYQLIRQPGMFDCHILDIEHDLEAAR